MGNILNILYSRKRSESNSIIGLKSVNTLPAVWERYSADLTVFSIGWNTEHVITAMSCSKCVGSRRVKFCVGNFSFATVKFLSKISFMMVELIKCLVKWTISSGDSIFFTDATLVNINSLKFHQISGKCTENFSMKI